MALHYKEKYGFLSHQLGYYSTPAARLGRAYSESSAGSGKDKFSKKWFGFDWKAMSEAGQKWISLNKSSQRQQKQALGIS